VRIGEFAGAAEYASGEDRRGDALAKMIGKRSFGPKSHRRPQSGSSSLTAVNRLRPHSVESVIVLANRTWRCPAAAALRMVVLKRGEPRIRLNVPLHRRCAMQTGRLFSDSGGQSQTLLVQPAFEDSAGKVRNGRVLWAEAIGPSRDHSA
jgi:hypothetical protein